MEPKLKIGILGTRGIPNNYGGFEQFAEFLSKALVPRHEVYVYCSHDHPYQQNTWEGVHLIHKKDPENTLGTFGQFIYDYRCIIDSRKRGFDVLLQLGYTSSSVWGRFLPRRTKIVTNMDGLEWKRSKYNKAVQKFLLYAERLAVRTSDHLIADSIGIQTYLRKKYGVEAKYIPYGANIADHPNKALLSEFGFQPYDYNMLVARMEPENSIETILEGVRNSASTKKLVVIGNYKNNYGQYLLQKFKDEDRIIFLGPLYDLEKLNSLRYFSHIYFHGHTVGGTNPSLLEALGSGSLLCAHDNEFNRYILEDHAFYFRSAEDVKALVERAFSKADYVNFLETNFEKIRALYNWKKIVADYEDFFISIHESKSK